MDKNSIKAINRETSNFYLKHASEFSDTRLHPWAGWDHIAKIISNHYKNPKNLKILDIGCGNMRFEKYLEAVFPSTKIQCSAIDNCDKLHNVFSLNNTKIDFYSVDIIEALLEGQNIVEDNQFDLVVSFGLMHHLPDYDLRLQLIKYLISLLKTHGLLAISFWNYFNDKKLKLKSLSATKGALNKLQISSTDPNDRFLTWSDDCSVYRFCHNFDNVEIQKIIKDIEDSKHAKLLHSFNSDGKTNNLNRYLVVEKLS